MVDTTLLQGPQGTPNIGRDVPGLLFRHRAQDLPKKRVADPRLLIGVQVDVEAGELEGNVLLDA